ncbi:efflux RND transporter permease subunit [Kingella kingae]|uniref:efflux RND transporter permease subunit n=2 Tax=Kingella kingae TaxID=504 RepID=UPI0004132A07|nr:efflux RND transporter permease subunit [Kingella kingae]MDK4578776.1 efflux RND transporter permease subunit [Kingella kingae]MDK4609206.1 efflux RND transporter permease subunit [Kingella kingae]MDK4627161.1 efflux RND transporter permease subunit [Kingella kingae]MDK4674916.1 efflux RND transporter permease subunit [Kingella kingae]
MAKFFIDRPIFAWVIAIFIMLAGVIGISKLPISQYPSVAAPTITLTATYPGASAQVLEDSVLAVIERNMYGVEGLDYMSTSATSSGQGSITLTFTPDTDPDLAQVNVQNKLSEVNSQLPSIVQQNGVNVSKARSNFLMVVMLTSDTRSTEEIADYAQRNVIPELQRIDGVGNVNLFGAQRAMRVWVDPAKLKSYGLSFADVSSAISAQNAQLAIGSLGAQPANVGQTISATITADGQLKTAEEFGAIMLKSNATGANVYLRDVAKIELGSQSYGSTSRLNGKPTTGMAVSLSTTGNAMATATAVRAKMAELEEFFPSGVTWVAPYDTSKFVELSIKKVVSTLFEAIALVFLVMFLFLQNFRYTLIPTIVVPISLLGAFAAISYLGMSINVMTMFAMVLVIGIVVDDAIVVVENVERIMAEEGLSPRQATKKAMRQISGAVIGITAVLISVFVPLAMFSGATGNIYRQFALTMAFAIGFSAFLALSLTPALCATMLKPIAKGHNHAKTGFFGWFNRKFNSGTRTYSGWIATTLRKAGVMVVIYLAIIAGAAVLIKRLPTAFLPNEDQGFIMMSMQLPAGATQERTDASLATATQIITNMPEVENLITVSGFSFSGNGQNMAMGFAMLKDWSERTAPGSDANSLANKITGALMGTLQDGIAFALSPPPIMELGNDSGFGFYLQDRSNAGHDVLLARRNELMGKMRQNPMFNPQQIRSSGLEDAPQLNIEIDRATAAAQNVSFTSIRNVLGMALGSSYVNDFPNQGRLQRVIVQADAKARMQPADILALTVPNNRGELVPLSNFVKATWKTGMEQSVRFNSYPAMQLTGAPAAGKSTGEAMAEVKRMVDELEGDFSLEWAGQSREEAKGSSQTTMLYAFAALAVFLALAALYESWSIPFAVILVVPLGILGVGAGALIRSYGNDIYFTIGMITVMGLSAKNAILIIEFAKDLQETGKTAAESALRAAKLRFRPILMTSFAFILGVVPLYIATGASAASQRAIGTSVFWGMLIGTILSVFLVPIFYVMVRTIFKGKPVPEQGELDLFDGEEDMDFPRKG